MVLGDHSTLSQQGFVYLVKFGIEGADALCIEEIAEETIRKLKNG